MVISKKKSDKVLNLTGEKQISTLASRVVWKRKTLGLTAKDLAKTLDISPTSLNNLERGLVKIPRYVKALAEALNTDVKWLLTGDKQPNVVKISEHISILSANVPIKPDANFDYHIVRIKKGDPLFTPQDVEVVGQVNRIFIAHKS